MVLTQPNPVSSGFVGCTLARFDLLGAAETSVSPTSNHVGRSVQSERPFSFLNRSTAHYFGRLVGLMRIVGQWISIVGVVSIVGCGAQAPPFKSVVDNKVLMNSVIEKQANIVWESVGQVATMDGVEEKQPRTPEEWQNIRDAAVTITESANLLMLPTRAQDTEEWLQASVGLVDQGERMIAAIDRKNPQEVFDVGADIYEACVRCHRQYMPGVRELYRR